MTYPTILQQKYGGSNITYPDITICNTRGYDIAVLKNLLEFLEYKIMGKTNDSLLYEDIIPERFTKVYYKNIIEKYKVFLYDYYLTSYSPNVSQIYELLFSRIQLPAFMSKEDALGLGVPGWQLILDCSYGKDNELVILQC